MKTDIQLSWDGPCPVFLHVRCPRVFTSDELHTLANVVSSIEEFRAVVVGELPELTE